MANNSDSSKIINGVLAEKQTTVGGTDGTIIGNVGDRSKTDSMIVGADGAHRVDVELQAGKRRMLTDATITVEEIFGRDPFPDSYFIITTAGAIDNTIRIQVDATTADPTSPDRDVPAVDLTYTLVAADVGNELKLRDNLISYLNAQTGWQNAFLKAQVAKDLSIVHVTSTKRSLENEFYERTGVNAFQVTTTGTTAITLGYSDIRSRGKSTSLARDPDSPHRLGILGIAGSVFVTPGGIGDIVDENALNGSSANMLVNGSSTPVVFTISAHATKDTFFQTMRFAGNGNGIKFGQFLSQNNNLTNGILVEIKSDNIYTALKSVKSTDDLKRRWSNVHQGFDLDVQAGRDDFIADRISTVSSIPIRKQGAFGVGNDDYIKVTIRDNLTSNLLALEFIAFGFRRDA